MPLAAATAGTAASQPAAFRAKAAFGPATVTGHPSGAMLKHAVNQDSTKSDSACSSMELVPNSSSASATSCNTALHPEDEKSVDQDGGWQVVAGKSSSKVPGQHPPPQLAGIGTPSTASTGRGQVCGRCGMRGHLSANCKQPHCSRCNKWWHTQDECAKACYTCGSLDHRVCGASLCKSYKCRECGLYGHVYAECPNIRCNLCSEVGHKALECPSIVCNICKQKGHKAVHCTQPRSGGSHPAAASKPAAIQPMQSVPAMQQLRPVTAKQSQPQASSTSTSSVTSPTSVSSPASAVATTRLSAAAGSAAAADALVTDTSDLAKGTLNPTSSPLVLPEVPLQQLQRPSNLAEQQQLQQQHSRMLALLLKAAPDLAAACLDDSNKLQAVFMMEPQYLMQLLNSTDKTPEMRRQQLEAAVASSQRQLQQQQLLQHSGQLGASRCAQLPPTAGGTAVQRRLALSSSSALSVAAAVTSPVEDVTDATQGIKPGDLAPQHARQLVTEFGDMLPSRWQQLPSWRQLEARLSFPDGNYVQRRLQFREKRRQLQLLTLQLRATPSGKQQAAATASSRAGGVAATTGRPAAHPRVVPELPAAAAASTSLLQHQTPPANKSAGSAPCSYAAALAGRAVAGSAADIASPCSSTSSSQQVQEPGSPFPADTGASVTGMAAGVAVCSRCGMMGHSSCSCAQPRCSRCHLWWHTEAQCNSACQFCGSLDHAGDAEQPSSCKSFKCKACRMFGHTQSICPHVQLHNQQLQRQSSSLGSSSCLLPPASPMSNRGPGTAGSSSNGSSETSSICPPDSPGLGQQGIKPKDLLPEHAKALQDEFPHALPPGWQQMGSWRMVEERLRVVAVEGAVFSKRRQMWRDRRKHYQAMTAQALAAAARSAAAANVAAAEESAAAVAAATRLTANTDRITSTAGQLTAGGAEHAPNSVQSVDDEHQRHVDKQQAQLETAVVGQDWQHGAEQKNKLLFRASEQQLLERQQSRVAGKQQETQQHVQPAAAASATADGNLADHQQHQTHDLPDSQQCSMDPVLVPEWQQQQGSLFGLVDAAPGSMPMDSTATGSAVSCDTHFSASPTEASRTPNVMLSPFIDRLGYRDGSTPAAMSANSSKMVTPAASTAGYGALQSCGSFSTAMSSPMPPAACNTPVPTPRSAADAAAAAASVLNGAVYTSRGMVPIEGRFSPMAAPHSSVTAGAMRSPLGHPSGNCAPPTSPMDIHNAAAAAVMASGRPTGPVMYQHMVHVAQRQSQLQQQLMLQQGRYRSPAEQPLGNQQQQMLLQMQQQQQMRMRQCRMDQAFLVQQQVRQQQQHHQQYQKLQSKAVMAVASGDELAETCELDDTLGVLGVLGLQ